MSGARGGALVAGGVGVVAMGVGTVFGITAMSKHSSGQDADAGTPADAASWAFGIGGACLAAGLVLWIWNPGDHADGGEKTVVRLAPSFGPDRAGIALGGSF
jgi:hypothetical protein